MGSFSYLTFADYPIFEYKNWYFREIINLIFLQSDFIHEKRKKSTKNKLCWGNVYENEEGYFDFIGFKQTVNVCKQRLEIYGTSMKKAKKNFTLAKKISRDEGYLDFSLSGCSYDNYLSEINNIINTKDKNYNDLYTNFRESLISGDLGIFGQSLECHLFSILSVLSGDSIIEYDLSDVITNGWVKEKEVETIDFEKIIILTEGKTDVEFISKSIEALYPHLKDYYHFIDFEDYKIEHSASALVKMVLALAASNVKHPIIALFDNDTAGIKEMTKLITRKLPSNFRVLKYPNIEFAKKYPTLGPTGKKTMNVNCTACGIEMYLGKDSLTKNNMLIPIQWTSFEKGENKYQGEVSEKNYVQDLFRENIKKGELSQLQEMDILLHEIFYAFL